MSIIELIDYDVNTDGVDFVIKATAMIEDAVITHRATFYDPEEYGPALCEATIILYDYDGELTKEVVTELLEENADWEPCESVDQYE